MNKEETFNEAYDRLMRTGRSHTVYIDDRKHVDAERWCRTHFGKRLSLDVRDGVWACFWADQIDIQNTDLTLLDQQMLRYLH